MPSTPLFTHRLEKENQKTDISTRNNPEKIHQIGSNPKAIFTIFQDGIFRLFFGSIQPMNDQKNTCKITMSRAQNSPVLPRHFRQYLKAL
jgi:hypothetical protein